MSEGIDYILEQVIPDIMGPLPVGGQQFSKAVGFTGNTIQKDLYGNISRLPKVQNFRDNSLSLVNNTQRFFDVGKFYRDSKNLYNQLKEAKATNYNFSSRNPSPYAQNISKDNHYLVNLYDWVKEASRVGKLNIKDDNTHQYMGCLAGKAGDAMALTMKAVGFLKELTENTYKPFFPKRYGSKMEIYADGYKDSLNNLKGLEYAQSVLGADCNQLLFKKLP